MPWAQASRSADNLVLLVNRDIQRHFDVFAVLLQGLGYTMESDGRLADVGRLHRALAFAAQISSDVGAIYVLDPQGGILAESDSPNPRQADFSDRDYFAVHRDRTDAGSI